MKFEKFVNSPFSTFMNFLYDMIILNLVTCITIILGLGVFSFFPAMVSLVLIIKCRNNQELFPKVKTFYKAFFTYYKKSFLLSLFYLVFMILLASLTFYFYCWVQEASSPFFFAIGYYLCLFIDCVFVVAMINAIFIFVYFPHLTNKKIIRYSFVLLRVITWKALVLFAILFFFVMLTYVFIYILPIILISLYAYLFNLFVKKDYTKLLPKGMESLNIESLSKKG